MAVYTVLVRPGDASPVVAVLEGDNVGLARFLCAQLCYTFLEEGDFSPRRLPAQTIAVIVVGEGREADTLAKLINGEVIPSNE